MLAVIVIILALLALTYPVVGAVTARQSRDRTQALVQDIAAAIQTYRLSLIAVPNGNGGTAAMRQLWDFNDDRILDGDPALDEGFTTRQRDEAARAGYRGLLEQTGAIVSSRFIDRQRRIVDAWGIPLRLATGSKVYGVTGIGIWSYGPDRQPVTADDITSWKDESHAP